MSPRADLTTKLRLAFGLVLMTFTAGHLVNHALGIYSVAAMEQGRALFVAVWRSPPGTLVLFGALFGHIALVLLKLYRRRSLRLPPWEIVQIGLGLLIPFWLTVHVVGTFGIHERFGVDDDYTYLLNVLWPDGAARQSLMLLIVWLHGCIGIHFWLRIRPWYRTARPLLFAIALLLPTLALIGFAEGGREVKELAADPAWLAAQVADGDWPTADEQAWVYRTERWLLFGFGVVLLAVVGGRGLRALRQRTSGLVRLRYPGGIKVAIAPGMSVLEASRSAGIPHASVCGGRGRCSTCRVRVVDGAERQPPAAADEARVLARIGATGGSVRLACQLRPTHDLEVVPLLPASAGPSEVRVQLNPGQGVEREIAVLFADLRAFTRMAEGRLPYDVVFVLNQYFKAMGQAIEDAGGRVDKFIGDGIMALFGIDLEPEEACRRALAGARAMALALDALNRELEHDLREPLRIGIGLHAGPVILGEMGYRRATSLTAIGDPVNVASRLEALTKELGAQLVVSAALAERGGIDLTRFDLRQIEIRGRRRPLRIRVVEDARALPVADAPATRLDARPWARLLRPVLSRQPGGAQPCDVHPAPTPGAPPS
jgi:adenylate cyclase